MSYSPTLWKELSAVVRPPPTPDEKGLKCLVDYVRANIHVHIQPCPPSQEEPEAHFQVQVTKKPDAPDRILATMHRLTAVEIESLIHLCNMQEDDLYKMNEPKLRGIPFDEIDNQQEFVTGFFASLSAYQELRCSLKYALDQKRV